MCACCGKVTAVTVQIGEMTMVGMAVVDITKKNDRTLDATFGEWPDLACVVQSAPMCELGRSADRQAAGDLADRTLHSCLRWFVLGLWARAFVPSPADT